MAKPLFRQFWKKNKNIFNQNRSYLYNKLSSFYRNENETVIKKWNVIVRLGASPFCWNRIATIRS